MCRKRNLYSRERGNTYADGASCYADTDTCTDDSITDPDTRSDQCVANTIPDIIITNRIRVADEPALSNSNPWIDPDPITHGGAIYRDR